MQQERAAKQCEACLANGFALYRSIARLSAGFCRARRTVGDVGGCEPDVEVSRTDVIAAELRRTYDFTKLDMPRRGITQTLMYLTL